MAAAEEAITMIAQGKRNLVCGEIPNAVTQFQEACKVLAKAYGETAKECAEAYFYYGQALLDLARMENGVLGNALKGALDEDDDANKSADEQFEKAEDLDEEGDTAEEEGEEEGEEEEGEDTAEEDTAEETSQDEAESGEKKENPDDISNLQLAWEMLELAKVIYLKDEAKEAKLKAAESFLKLGEVSLETEQYEQAVSDFKECLKIQESVLEAEDRLLAETHYQLGLAYGFDKKYDESITHYKKAIQGIEDKVEPAAKDDPVKTAQQEIKELQEILPDIKSKVEDMEEEKKNIDELKNIAKEAMGGLVCT
ncbi:hypothetical protein FSP39_014727 [Pinctada imbricata]|uniref:Tetratricopeptide SHNi-TPR domain-containing protein n=1 Tax=Pinctada imbricata TaxID=66713 RepID=A0AA88XSA0_PINIB|nr:hypothetical protein FSP39_014727 [Pinctada imbricata]